jgi:hypothetical protein
MGDEKIQCLGNVSTSIMNNRNDVLVVTFSDWKIPIPMPTVSVGMTNRRLYKCGFGAG